jgi:hypothetical protein
MTKKNNRWTSIMLIAALLVALAMYWRADAEPTSGPQDLVSPVRPPADSRRFVTEGVDSRPERTGIRPDTSRLFVGATNAANFFRELDASALAPGEKQQYRLLVALICDARSTKARDYIQNRDANKPVVLASRKLSSSFSYGYFNSFCNVPGIEMTAEAEAFKKVDPSDETLQALELVNLGESGETALASQRAQTLLSSSTSAAAVSRAMDYLVGAANAAPLGSDLPFPEATAQENFNAHRMAAARWSCEQRGGCGPGEFFSVLACQPLNNCRPGITADAAWRQGHRPGVIARAAEIHRRLAALHAKADEDRRRN